MEIHDRFLRGFDDLVAAIFLLDYFWTGCNPISPDPVAEKPMSQLPESVDL